MPGSSVADLAGAAITFSSGSTSRPDGGRKPSGRSRYTRASSLWCHTMLNNLLDVTRARAGQPLDLQLQATDLVALGNQVVREYQPMNENHHFVVEAPPTSVVGQWDAARIVTRHGGTIDVTSAAGHGATFTVHLPLGQ